jgi:hypothetical protein
LTETEEGKYQIDSESEEVLDHWERVERVDEVLTLLRKYCQAESSEKAMLLTRIKALGNTE